MTRVSLTLAEAEQCVTRAVRKAKEIGIEISVAVVDENGRLRSFARMDGANWLSPDIAIGKAFTAVALRRPTAETIKRYKDYPNFASSINAIGKGMIVLGEGGLLLEKKGEVVGGIGVSGGTRNGEDDACSVAGLLERR